MTSRAIWRAVNCGGLPLYFVSRPVLSEVRHMANHSDFKPTLASTQEVLQASPRLAAELAALMATIKHERAEQLRQWEEGTALILQKEQAIAFPVALVAAKHSRAMHTASKRALQLEQMLKEIEEV